MTIIKIKETNLTDKYRGNRIEKENMMLNKEVLELKELLKMKNKEIYNLTNELNTFKRRMGVQVKTVMKSGSNEYGAF